MSHVLRPALTTDITEIMEVERSAHDYPWAEKIMSRFLHRPDSVWVMQGVHGLLAHAVFGRVLDEAELMIISVAKQEQGRGIGRELLKTMMVKLRIDGVRRIYLEVRESNRRAIRMYESLGFSHNGRRKGYYPSDFGREDALLYSITFDEI